MTPDPGLLATPEELAARKAKAVAEAQSNLSPAEALVAAHDHVSDDELAERIAAHPDRDIFLALWRRITGDVAREVVRHEDQAPTFGA